jgi:hypothetical protein
MLKVAQTHTGMRYTVQCQLIAGQLAEGQLVADQLIAAGTCHSKKWTRCTCYPPLKKKSRNIKSHICLEDCWVYQNYQIQAAAGSIMWVNSIYAVHSALQNVKSKDYISCTSTKTPNNIESLSYTGHYWASRNCNLYHTSFIQVMYMTNICRDQFLSVLVVPICKSN